MSDKKFCTYAQFPYASIARCAECEWRDDDYLKSKDTGKEHVIKTGHRVMIEEGYSLIRTTLNESGRSVLEGREPKRL